MDAAGLIISADLLLQRTRGWHVRRDAAPLQLEGSRRCLVQRIAVDGPNAPATVILKGHRRSFATFLNEAAAADFLGSTDDLARFGPRLWAADPDVPLVVLEDLGPQASLADALIGDDRDRALGALLGWAIALGRLHAATIGAGEEFEARRRRLAGGRLVPFGDEEPSAEVRRGVEAICDLGVERPAGLESELDAVTALAHSGELNAFSPSDACPDNNVVTRDGVRFFDFEGARFRHAFLDAAYLRIWQPTCWCVGRVPPEVPLAMQRSYRQALGQAAADHDGFFADRMARACGWWLLVTTGWLLPRLRERDLPAGPPGRQPATRRQFVVYRLELFPALAEEWDSLPAIAALARAAASELRRRWPPADCSLPAYPAFR